VDTVLLRNRSKLGKLYALFQSLLSGQPLESKLAFEQAMQKKLVELLSTQKFDIVQIEHTFMAPYLKTIRKLCDSKIIIVVHNIGFVQYKRMFKIAKKTSKKLRFFSNWLLMRKWEAKYLKNFDKIITLSSLDKEMLCSLVPQLDISIIQNAADVDSNKILPVNPDKKNILFIGYMEYDANHDAALYFYRKIFPFITAQIPQTRFFIVGKGPQKQILELSKDHNVVVTGHVDDIRPYYQFCDVSVVPLRAGGGTRGKILEAMSLGRPVVSTSLGCEGFDMIDNKHLMVADDPVQFAEKTVRLLKDEDLYKRITQEARKLVEEKYSWDAIADELLDVYSNMMQ